jgi:hypothetical protein
LFVYSVTNCEAQLAERLQYLAAGSHVRESARFPLFVDFCFTRRRAKPICARARSLRITSLKLSEFSASSACSNRSNSIELARIKV